MAGRKYVFEHPASATSWKMPELIELALLDGAHASVFHMCQYGMTAADKVGSAPVYKPTRILTNSEVAADKCNKKCQGGTPVHHPRRRHGQEGTGVSERTL